MKVSVILTSYNHAKYLRYAIESALSQTFSHFELIIWDDASTDESWEIINSYQDARIRAFRNPVNMHRGNINRGLEKARGEYIAVHHSDDVWEPEKLEKQVAFLDAHPEIGAVFSDVLVIDENGEDLPEGSHPYQTIFAQPNRSRHEWLNYFFYRGNALCHPSVLIRKQCYSDCGAYRSGFSAADYDMWVRLCMQYEIHVLPDKLLRLRVRDNNANASGNRPEVRLRDWFERLQVLKNYRNLASQEDILKIFPTLYKYLDLKGFLPSFVLSMAALESEQAYNITRLFGLELLFELMNDPDSARQVEEMYGFTRKDFIALEGKYDVFSLESMEQLRANLAEKDALLAEKDALLAEKDALLAEKERALQGILQSRSWKIVSALGRLMSFLKLKT